MHNQISLRTLFIAVTVFAAFIACFQNLPRGVVFASLFSMLLTVVLTFTSFAAMFLIMLPFAHLNKYLDEKSDEGTSPFAQDRLPTQIVPPIERGAE